MQRIQTLLKKIDELANKADKIDLIEVDLMLDYTKVLYADLLELRSKKVYTGQAERNITPPPTPTQQPATQAEITEAPKKAQEEVIIPEDEIVNYNDKPLNITNSETEPKPVVEEIKIEELPAPQAPKEQRNINKIIGINDKYQYISELFGNDKEAYDVTLKQINNYDNADEAVSWLKSDISKKHNWDDELVSVQMFYDTVNTFFSAR